MLLVCAINAENEASNKRIRANDFFISTTPSLKIGIRSENNMI
jgi:hypothetical protein